MCWSYNRVGVNWSRSEISIDLDPYRSKTNNLVVPIHDYLNTVWCFDPSKTNSTEHVFSGPNKPFQELSSLPRPYGTIVFLNIFPWHFSELLKERSQWETRDYLRCETFLPYRRSKVVYLYFYVVNEERQQFIKSILLCIKGRHLHGCLEEGVFSSSHWHYHAEAVFYSSMAHLLE